MEIKIKPCNNGYIMDVDGEVSVFEGLTNDSFIDLCYALQQEIGLITSRHSEERVYHIKAPGDKNEKFTNYMYDIIYGD
jgi:hypothetical protein